MMGVGMCDCIPSTPRFRLTSSPLHHGSTAAALGSSPSPGVGRPRRQVARREQGGRSGRQAFSHVDPHLPSVPAQNPARDPCGPVPARAPLHPPLHHLRTGAGPTAEPQVRAAEPCPGLGGGLLLMAGDRGTSRRCLAWHPALPGLSEGGGRGRTRNHLPSSPYRRFLHTPSHPRFFGCPSSPGMGGHHSANVGG